MLLTRGNKINIQHTVGTVKKAKSLARLRGTRTRAGKQKQPGGAYPRGTRFRA